MALTTATDKLWESSDALSDWSQLCLPLCKITEEANEAASAQFVPLAWTLWRDWLAQAPLIAHLARLAQRELSRIDGTLSPASIEARVDDDTEEFSSPEGYPPSRPLRRGRGQIPSSYKPAGTISGSTSPWLGAATVSAPG